MNRRISIIVMNREAEDRLLKLAPDPPEAEAAVPIGASDPGASGPVAAAVAAGAKGR